MSAHTCRLSPKFIIHENKEKRERESMIEMELSYELELECERRESRREEGKEDGGKGRERVRES